MGRPNSHPSTARPSRRRQVYCGTGLHAEGGDMSGAEPAPGCSSKPVHERLSRSPGLLGFLLVLLGGIMTVVGFVYALGEVTGWPMPLLYAGLATLAAGASLIVWRVIALVGRMIVRLRRSS